MAIAFDAVSKAENQAGTSVTFAHTCTGSDLLLVVGVSGLATNANANVTGITYNGVAMTLIGSIDEHTNQNRNIDYYYLLDPDTGAHNIVVSFGTAPDYGSSSGGASYTGVDTKNVDGTYTSGASNVTTIAQSVTTTVDNCWVLSWSCNGSGTGTSATASAGSYLRQKVYNRTSTIYEGYNIDSDGAKSPAGSYSSSYTSGSCKATMIVAGFSPSGAAPAATVSPSGTLTLLGCGM